MPDGGYGAAGAAAPKEAPKIETLKKQFLDYHGAKTAEIREAVQARHYYHGDQWTAEEIKELNRRRQPVITYNRIQRKIDGIVGLLERLRQDPKAYPRTPQHAEGADLSTAVLRYQLDNTDWQTKSPEEVRCAATEGIGGVSMLLVPGDQGDPEIDLEPVQKENFFYDPRSFALDFSDSRYFGESKWVDESDAKAMFPEEADQITASLAAGDEFDTEGNRDRAMKWTNIDAKHIRIVEQWYKHQGEWCWAFYTGDRILKWGPSPFYDENGRTISKYLVWSAAVDHDGDRYGFARGLKGPQDEINYRRSKGLYETMGRRVIIQKGMFDDVEKARKELVRADGVVEYNNVGDQAPKFDDAKSDAQVRAQLEFLAEAKAEIENFGPNPALLGQGLEQQSGRAIALLQQAGMAELGPFIIAHRGWKIRVYRAVWCAMQRHWKQERWIRVTDNEGLAQFVQINGVGIDPQTQQPTMVNALGALDVDIILDEGPDTINMQADAYEAMRHMPPQLAAQFPEAWIELLPIEESVKKQMRDKLKAPNPMQEIALKGAMAKVAGDEAKVGETKAKTIKALADAEASQRPEMPDIQAPPASEPKTPSQSINFKDIPPEAQSQMLAQVGIFIPPQIIVAHAEMEAQRRAAEKAASRPQSRPPQQVS